jgi:hypothetical protein
MKTRKTGKVMKFSQAVIGKSSKRSKKKSIGIIAAPSTGKVNKSPSKPKAPSLRGKRIY